MNAVVVVVIVNGARCELPAGATLLEAVAPLAPTTRGVAVAVNGAVVRRAQWGTTVLRDADRVELLTAVPGG